MTDKTNSVPQQPRVATVPSHGLSWIAMVVMAAMCLGALIYAASLNVD